MAPPALAVALQGAPSLVYLKTAVASPTTSAFVPGSGRDQQETTATVARLLHQLEAGGEVECLRMARQFDGSPALDCDTVEVTTEQIKRAIASLPQSQIDDIDFQHARVKDFAEAQVGSIKSFERELFPGVRTGQRVVPVQCAGCYVPGGRFSHVSSAIMSVATAKAAGVQNVIACSPPFGTTNVMHPATLYALHLAGADRILTLGGVQAIAAMAFGFFTNVEADILVGPGNKWVAEAKRSLFGRVGIDMVAGPTEVLILADSTADPLIVAYDLLSQAEHGATSPTWLITTDRHLGEEVVRLMPGLIADLVDRQPGTAAPVSWRDFGEVVLVNTREEMAALSDRYAAEHLEVHCADLEWYLSTLQNYGSLFLGEETCVPFGDKCTGPNHILPTRRAARFTGGLSVDKFRKTLTWQRMDRGATRTMGAAASRISRIEGMEGHALSGDARLAKYYPDQSFDLGSPATRIADVASKRRQFDRRQVSSKL